jgi:hypothetical protein
MFDIDFTSRLVHADADETTRSMGQTTEVCIEVEYTAKRRVAVRPIRDERCAPSP